jgi:hypothetical protein
MIQIILEIFLPCFFSGELLIASSKLSSSLFHSNWMNQGKSTKQTMKIFMENSKREMKMMAFGVFELNLSNFLKVINSAFSLFAVLKSLN